MSRLSSERFLLTTSTIGTPLVFAVKRYRRISREGAHPNDPGCILLLGHGAGFPKEIWEPTLEELFKEDDSGGEHHIREAWALDCQNHGEAGVINGDIFPRNPGLLTIWDFADAFATLYRSGLLGPIDQKTQKVVLIGHSAGSVGVTLATSFFQPSHTVPFSLILVDPPMSSTAKRDEDTELYKLAEAMTPIRRDKWVDMEAAVKWLRARPPCDSWDPKVFDIFIKYGIQPMPSAYYPDQDKGVTLTTHRLEENAAFDGKRFAGEAVNRLNQICRYVPVHLVYGERNDMFDREYQDSLIDPKEGRTFASITRVPDAGHLVVQEAPVGLAQALHTILKGEMLTLTMPAEKSKL